MHLDSTRVLFKILVVTIFSLFLLEVAPGLAGFEDKIQVANAKAFHIHTLHIKFKPYVKINK